MQNNDTITIRTKRHAHTITAARAARVLDVLSAARDRRSGIVYRVDDNAEERIDNAERDALARLKSALDACGIGWLDSTYRNDAGPSLSSTRCTDDGEPVWQCWCIYDHDTSTVIDNTLIRCGVVRYQLSARADCVVNSLDVVDSLDVDAVASYLADM